MITEAEVTRGPARSSHVDEPRRVVRERQLFGTNIEGKIPEVLSYLDEGEYNFCVLFGEGNWDGVVAKPHGITSIPRTFLIDRDGRIIFAAHSQGLQEEQIESAKGQR